MSTFKCKKEYDIVCKHVLNYINNICNHWYYITPKQLRNNIDDYYMIDVRQKKDYNKSHIKQSINIPCNKVFDKKYLSMLPIDKKILIICYVGHSASQIMTLLRLLGYDIYVLKYGMGQRPIKRELIAGWFDYGYSTV
jgi:rhodanese-related sulfurtransferase